MRSIWWMLAVAWSCDHAAPITSPPAVARGEAPAAPITTEIAAPIAAPVDAGSPDAGAGAPGAPWVTLATGQSGPTQLAVTDTAVVWLDETGGQVMSVPKAGGTPVVLAHDQERPLDLAVDATTVYWTTRTGNGDSDSMTAPHATGGVWSVPLAGGKVASIAKGRAFPDAIAVDATSLYFGEQGLLQHAGAQLSKVARSGGAVTAVRAGEPGGIAVDGDHVYWSVGGTCESVNGAKMPDDGSMWSSPIAKPSPKQLASKLRCPEKIATDADSIYVADNDTGAILAIPKAGGAPVVVVQDAPGTRWLAVDATTVYWINQRTGTVKRRAKAGGPVELLASRKDPQGIAVDDHFVYLTDSELGTVERMPK
jgi:sugar lactone lactonase YvrE|nr:hypothetical protein [Kofleriaceae bacterium]